MGAVTLLGVVLLGLLTIPLVVLQGVRARARRDVELIRDVRRRHRDSEVSIELTVEEVEAFERASRAGVNSGYRTARIIEKARQKKLSHATRQAAGPRSLQRATYALDALSTLVPKRISSEEIGDALEAIDRLMKAGRPKWFIYTKVATTYFWVLLHTLLHYAEQAAGIWATATGKGKDEE